MPMHVIRLRAGSFFIRPHIFNEILNQPNSKRFSTDVLDKYRRYGHLRAKLSPIVSSITNPVYNVDIELPKSSEGYNALEEKYCSSIGYEFMHCSTLEERNFFSNAAESDWARLTLAESRNAATLMLKGYELENFLSSKYVGLKFYGINGIEALLPAVDTIVGTAGSIGTTNIVIGQAHRGRLALLVSLLGYSASKLFWKLDGNDDIPKSIPGVDDVNSHIYTSSNVRNVRVSLLPNPSHLEAVVPVVLGKVRAQLDVGRASMPLLIHGDAALAGQGVVAESLAMMSTQGYTVGGAIHLVTNNLLGFTASNKTGRSSCYATDIAKMVNAPVLHVNADDIDSVVFACKTAVEYRSKFGKDVFVDLIGYRRSGHNEVDEPSFTSPLLYKAIRARTSRALTYADVILGKASREALCSKLQAHLDIELKVARGSAGVSLQFTPAGGCTGVGSGSSSSTNGTHIVADGSAFGEKWSNTSLVLKNSELGTSPMTGIDITLLRKIGRESVAVDRSIFSIHDRLIRSHINARLDALSESKESIHSIDWSTAEALAFGSIVAEGKNVRISGQDVERGTFSNRHAVLIDQVNENKWRMFSPHLHAHSSLLSEFAVLGFEYGYSLDDPNALVLWEAQFGDFANGAQIIIDQFISSGESKWLRSSGLVMLLPHGQDGAGPEHSSARIERFLQLCNSEIWSGIGGFEAVDKTVTKISEPLNMIIAQPTTPANYFHLLRRQLARSFRKPLIIATPKQLLRLPEAASRLDQMGTGTSFLPVLIDETTGGINTSSVKRIVLCSGKIYYELDAARRKANKKDIAIVRLEELAPFPTFILKELLEKYSSSAEIVWVQDEPANAGAWQWVHLHLQQANISAKYIGRPSLPAAAVGLKKRDKAMQDSIISTAIFGNN
jgi:2-oxoglutarate dehydrogenase complex dehydrogenase (E1) component-like enzyme